MGFKILISILMTGLIYFQAKTTYWARNVAAPYMEALYYSGRCLSKQVHKEPIEVAQFCGKAIRYWADYKMRIEKYHKYFPL